MVDDDDAHEQALRRLPLPHSLALRAGATQASPPKWSASTSRRRYRPCGALPHRRGEADCSPRAHAARQPPRSPSQPVRRSSVAQAEPPRIAGGTVHEANMTVADRTAPSSAPTQRAKLQYRSTQVARPGATEDGASGEPRRQPSHHQRIICGPQSHDHAPTAAPASPSRRPRVRPRRSRPHAGQ